MKRCLALSFAALLIGAGCKSQSSTTQPAGGTAPQTQWEPIPQPDLSKFDPTVRETLKAAEDKVRLTFRMTQNPAELGAAMGEAGVVYLAYDLDDAAHACFVNAAKGQPKNYRWHYFLGRLFEKYGVLEKALVSFRRANELEPDDVPTKLGAAEILLRGNRPDQAKVLFEEALAADPRHPMAWYGLGRCSLALRDPVTAIEQLQTARLLSPECTAVFEPLARAYGQLGDSDRVTECLASVGTIPPTWIDPLMQEVFARKSGRDRLEAAGEKAFNSRNFSEAVAIFQQILELNPADSANRANLAAAMAMAGDIPGAIEEYEHALQDNPENASAHFGLGTLQARLGRDDQAVEHYEDALAVNPRIPGARLNLANALHRLRRFEDALEQYDEVINLEPDNVLAQYLQGVVLARIGRSADARSVLEQALALRPNNAVLTHGLSRVLAASPDDAVRNPDRALQLLEQDKSAPELDRLRTLAMAYAAKADWEKAIGVQQRVVEAAAPAGDALLAVVRDDLERFKRHERADKPWRDDDPISYPLRAQPVSATPPGRPTTQPATAPRTEAAPVDAPQP